MDIRLDQQNVFAFFDRTSIKQRTLEAPANCQELTISGGTKVSANPDGRLVFAEYESGIRVRRNLNSVIVKSADGTYWYGDCKGHWFRLD